MKTKLVRYMNMFNPAETITAKNKIETEQQYIAGRLSGMVFKNREEKEVFLRRIAQETGCECHHYNGNADFGGVCFYRNCRHAMKDHPGLH